MTEEREIKVRNPRTGTVDYRFRPAGAPDIKTLAEHLRAGQASDWQRDLQARILTLRRFVQSIDHHREALLRALSEDTGRERVAEIEVASVKRVVERAIELAEAAFARPVPVAASIPGLFAHTQLVPYALVGVISPWNFPLLLAMIDAIPALAAGCSVLLKPSEITPRHSEVLQQCIDDVPALASVLAIAQGDGATGAQVIDVVDAVAFTGSVRTGRHVARRAAERFIPAFLEMGGNDAVIVTDSAKLSRAVPIVLRAAVAAAGQACQSVERVYVQDGIYDEFIARLVQEASSLELTAGVDGQGHIGPLIFAQQADIIQSHVDDALEQGARVLCGGKPLCSGGIWYPPTILTDVHHRMRIMQEETFGPVIPVMRFTRIEDAIELANDTDYGLSANVFTGDEAEGVAIAQCLDAGVVSVNEASLSTMVHEFEQEPFKHSGMGPPRMGASSITRYCRKKLIVSNRSEQVRGVESLWDGAR